MKEEHINTGKIQEDIRNSARKLEIPDKLKPENLDILLEDGKAGKDNSSDFKIRAADFFWSFRKMAVAAAVFIILTAVFIMAPMRQSGNNESSGESASMVKAGDEEGSKAISEKDSDEGFTSAADYDEVYEKVYTEPRNAWKARDKWMNEENTFEEIEKAESVTDSAAMDTGASQGTGGSTSYSDTNVRTEGVDEGDIVKTDGHYIYTATSSGTLRIVLAEQGKMEISQRLSLENMSESIKEMYVDGDTLCLITCGQETRLDGQKKDVYGVLTRDYIRLYTYDISDKNNISLKGTVTQDGTYESSRKTGNYVYLFSRFYVNAYQDTGKDELQFFIPGINGARLEASQILYPDIAQADPSQLVISSVNLSSPDQAVESKSLISGSDMYYVSKENIYICTQDYSGDEMGTQLVRFSYKDGKIAAKAAGRVNGQINDTFSIDEYKGYLRIAATRYQFQREFMESSSLYVLDENMQITGKVEDLAKGETIRSARFMGDTGYFVTYRQTDPLFSVNLKDPENPQIIGALKITGFSEYLHFYGENKLLGIGWETDPDTGNMQGLKMSMFDISNPAEVKEIHKMVLNNIEECSALQNYKGIMIDPKENIFGMAMGFYDRNTWNLQGFYGVFTYGEKEGFSKLLFENLGELTEENGRYASISLVRGIYIGDIFYLCHSQGIQAYDRNKEYAKCGTLGW